MKITKETVDQVATLAKLSFTDTEKEKIQQDLSKIIDFVEKINEIDTDGVEPLTHINESVNVLREDEAIETLTQEEALKNAPQKDSDYFKIPKVLNK